MGMSRLVIGHRTYFTRQNNVYVMHMYVEEQGSDGGHEAFGRLGQ